MSRRSPTHPGVKGASYRCDRVCSPGWRVGVEYGRVDDFPPGLPNAQTPLRGGVICRDVCQARSSARIYRSNASAVSSQGFVLSTLFDFSQPRRAWSMPWRRWASPLVQCASAPITKGSPSLFSAPTVHAGQVEPFGLCVEFHGTSRLRRGLQTPDRGRVPWGCARQRAGPWGGEDVCVRAVRGLKRVGGGLAKSGIRRPCFPFRRAFLPPPLSLDRTLEPHSSCALPSVFSL